jgi:hypothetical protein
MLAMTIYGNGVPLFQPGPTVVHAQATAAVGFVLNAGDIRFIFRQIQIAQEHVRQRATNPAATPLGPGPLQVNEPRLPFGLRTVDGSFNHLVSGQEKFGASDQVFPRLSPPLYRQGEPFDPDGPARYRPRRPLLQKRGTVVDSQPRIISNLIVDQTTRNPAAIDVATAANGGTLPPAAPLGTLPIGNVATDVGLSAPFNIMFTFFGQFFDHGLDLVNKSGGTVRVPLQADDPLLPLAGPTPFMALTRATNQPGPDGVSGDDPATPQDESLDDIREANNQTTPFVDQNQTYTSHASHQVFLRHYETATTGRPLPDGRLIDSNDPLTNAPAANIGTWRDVKLQAATVLGIQLVDTDVFNIPLLLTDPYGHFVPGPARGLPQFVLTNGGRLEGNTAGGGVPIPTNGRRINHGFLDDIAHNAAPAAGLVADANLTIDPISPIRAPGSPYDNELLDAHFVTGDGRGNENIALTSVHTVFHAEHNRARNYVDSLINTPGFLTAAEVNAWRAVDAGSGWGYGERLFQAARFITEMQYQHLVFEEFARKLVPSINPFIGDGINFRTDINPAISAEFAHQVYRLGHSMLTETISRTNMAVTPTDLRCPPADRVPQPDRINSGGPGQPRLTAAQAAGAIFQGGRASSR